MKTPFNIAKTIIRHIYWRIIYRLQNKLTPQQWYLPTSTDKITKDWIKEGLKNYSLHHTVDIETLSINHSSSGTTDRATAEISYKKDHETFPTTAFIKMPSTNFATAMFGAIFQLGINEVRFYQQLRDRMPLKVPRCYIGKGRDKGGDFILLLEDVTKDGYHFKEIGNRCTLEEAKLVMTALAKLHALFWESPELATRYQWITRFENIDNWDFLYFTRKYAINKVFKQYEDVIPPEIQASRKLLIDNYDKLEEQATHTPRTILHGDAHIGNMYFSNDSTESQDTETPTEESGKHAAVGLVDWQVIRQGPGMRDVSYFLIGSLPTALREQHQWELIQLYTTELNKAGVEGFDVEDAKAGYTINAIHPLISSIVTAAAGSMQDRKIFMAGLTRSCKAVVELNSIKALEEL